MSAPDNFVLTDSTYDSFVVGIDGQNEFKVWQGLVGAHYTPYVDGVGNLSWTNNGGLPNPPTVNVTGKGLTITGIVETSGDLPATADQFATYLVGTVEPYSVYMYYNGAWVNIGEIGKGEQGEPGFSPVVTVSSITGGHQISITDAEDTETFNVMDGADGAPGQPGRDGTDGVGVPTGGTTGQVLAKASGTDYDTEWVNQSGGGGTVQSVNNATPDQSGNITITADDIGTDATNISIQDALDDYVYVGTSAPTDPTTKIWLDTDEPGMSAVSSVNGKTGTVVLDADDVGAMPEWELVWENTSPSSNFAAQTITLDLSQYDAVEIVCNAANDLAVYALFSHFCLVGYKTILFRIETTTGNNRMYTAARYATVETSGISFTDATQSTATTNVSTLNQTNIPMWIFGIKGINR